MTLHVLGDVLVELLALDRYAGAAVVVFLLAMTLAIQGVGRVLELGVTVSTRSHLSLASYATGLTVLVTLIWPVVERFGAVGATRMPMWLEPVLFAGVAVGLVFGLFTSGERRHLVPCSHTGWAWLVARRG